MSNDLKYIVVTGAASGIGLAITNYLAEKGYHVFASDINQENLDKLNGCENITPLFMDVTNVASIQEAAEKISEITDGLDGLVNNAGLFVGGPLIEIPEKKVEQVISVNVLGVFKVTKNLFPLLEKRKGRVINIGSEAGRLSFPVNGPYSMSKFALEAYSDSLRRELMFLDMKVVHLQIGAVNTPLLDTTLSAYADDIDVNKTLFPNLINLVIDTCEKEKTRCAEPVDVAKVVHKALRKKYPRSRYKVKNNKGRRLLEFLPNSILDFSMKRMLK